MKRIPWMGLAGVVVMAAWGCTPQGRVDSRAVIRGHVVLQDVVGAKDVSRVRIDIGRGEGGVAPDDEGYFEFSDVEPDTYELVVTYAGGLTPEAEKSAYQRHTLRLVARAGAALELGDLELALARAPVSGSVTAPPEVETDGAEVTLEAGDGTRRVATLAAGVFRFEEVPVGHYGVSVRRQGIAFPAALTAAGCVAPLTVAQGEDEVTAPAVPVVGTRVGLDHAAGEVVATVVDGAGTRWFVLPQGADGGSGGSVTVRVDAPFAAQGRVWLNDDTPGGWGDALPAYGVSLTGSTTVFHAQFKDPCAFESEVYTLTLIHDAEPPVVNAPRVDGSATAVRTRALNVELVADDALSDSMEMQFVHCALPSSADCDLSAATWVPYQRQNAVVLEDAQGNHVVTARVKDRSGNLSPVLSTAVEYDSVPPQNPLLDIGTPNNIVATETPEVYPSADGATLMKVGLVSGLAAEPWIPMAPAITVDLGPGDGERTLYARFTDRAGNPTDELVVSVTVDTTGEIKGIVELAGAAPPAGSVIQLVGTSFMNIADDAGLFTLRAPAGSYTMVVNGPTSAADPWRSHQEQVRVEPGRTNDRGVILLQAKQGTITGRVTLEDSTDGGGVFVEVLSTAVSASTSTTGDFILGGVVAGTHSVRFSRSGYETRVINGIVVTDRGQATPGSDVALARKRGSARGVVALEGVGSAVGATVVVPGTALSANVAANGAWTLAGIPEGPAIFMISGPATGSAFVTVQAFATITAGAEAQVPSVTLRRVRNDVRGTFTLEDGTEHSGIVVTVENVDMAGVTTATGSFTIPGVPEGTWNVTASRGAEYAPVTRPVTVSATVSPTATGVLTLVRSAQVSASVTLEDGAAPTGALVTLSGTDFRGRTVSPATQTAGAAGTVTFSALVAGTYAVHAELAGYRSADTTLILTTGATVAAAPLALGVARGSARGTVSAAGAASPAGTLVTVNGPSTASVFTDSTGAWSVSGLREATGYTVTAQRDGYLSVTSAAFAVAQDATRDVPAIPLVLATSATLTGTVTVAAPAGANGGITVSATGEDVNGAVVTASATTNASGAYTLANLAQGTYSLDFSKTGYDGVTVRNITVLAADTVTAPSATLAISRGDLTGTAQLTAGTVSGFLVGADHSGIVVTLTDAVGTLDVAVTDANGGYRFASVPVSVTGAPYVVRASRPFFRVAQGNVTMVAHSSVGAGPLALAVDAASVSGTVRLRDDVGGAGNLNSAHGGVTVGFSGVAFNGRSFTTSATSAANGTYTLPPLPPGSYDVTVTSTNRNCGAPLFRALTAGDSWAMGTTTCVDTAAPTALTLAAVPAFTNVATGILSVGLTTPATDPTAPTSNLRGYQLGTGNPVVWGATPVAAGPFSFTLAANSVNVLSVRAVDYSGNAGPPASVTVTHDIIVPPTPNIDTPRALVNATTTSVTLSGSEADSSFDHYEICTMVLAHGAPEPGTCTGTFARTAASFALSLAADQRTWLFARALDKAANASGDRKKGITSDLTRPTAPVLAPQFDPTTAELRARDLEIHIMAPPTDVPVTGGNWKGIAYLEVDQGDGFAPVCALSACLVSGDTWDPCNCTCSPADTAMLICTSETSVDAGVTSRRLTGLRVRARDGLTNRFSIRGVDLAGNAGDGASVGFQAEQATAYDTSAGSQAQPALYGVFLAFNNGGYLSVHELDDLRRKLFQDRSSSGASCNVHVGRARHGERFSDLAMERAAAFSGNHLIHASVDSPGTEDSYVIRRTASAAGVFCLWNDVSIPLRRVVAPRRIAAVVALGTEGAAWVERTNYTGLPDGDDSKMVYAWRGPGALPNDYTDDVVVQVGAAAGGPTLAQQALLSGGGDHLLYSTGYHTGDATCPAPGATGSADVGCRRFEVHYVPPAVGTPLPPGSTFVAMAATLSPDGNTLLLVKPSGTSLVMEMRHPGVDGVYTSGGTSDDVILTRTLANAGGAGSAALEGRHAVVVAYMLNGNAALVDWSAGGDGVFADGATASDDEVTIAASTFGSMDQPALSQGLVIYVGSGVYAGDLLLKDLSQFKWLTLGLQDPVTNGEGTLVGRDPAEPTALVARGPTGGRTRKVLALRPSGGGMPDPYVARGRYLAYANATATGTDVFFHDAGADRTFFGGTDDRAARVFQMASPNQVARLDLYVGTVQRLMVVVRKPGATEYCDYHVIQGASLLSSPTTVVRANEICPLYGYSASQGPLNLVFDVQIPVYPNWVVRVVNDTNRDGTFSQADLNGAATLTKPGYGAALPSSYGRVEGSYLLASEGTGGFVLEAGVDGWLNSADDVLVASPGSLSDSDHVISGGFVYAVIAPVAGGGTQIYRYDIATGQQRKLTDYFSTKRGLRADPSGVVMWVDSSVPYGVWGLTQ